MLVFLLNNLIHFILFNSNAGLVSLTTLDVSFNQLNSLDNKTHSLLDDCLSLKYVSKEV